jgi:PAS domain S-box-containing protein
MQQCLEERCRELEARIRALEEENNRLIVTGDASGHPWTQEPLQTGYDQLEQRVQERTAELRVINESLQREITERKQMEEALRESEDKYRQLFELESDAIFLIDNESGRILEANTAASALYGYTHEELLAKKNTDLSAEPDETRRVTETTPIIIDQVVFIALRFHRKKDGTVFPIEITGRFFTWRGRPVHIAAMRDITQRRRAEQLLNAFNQTALAMERALTPEEIFSTVVTELKKLGFACVVLPLDESRSRLFPQYVSYDSGALHALERLVGLKHDDFAISIETLDVYQEVFQERRTVWVDNTEEALRQLLPWPAKSFAGQIVQVLNVPKSIIAPLVIEDEVIGLFTVQSDDLSEKDMPAITAFARQAAAAWRKAKLLQDLTHSLEELRRTQDELIQAQKMEAVGRLAGGIAHDFNNLLTAINGFAELIQVQLAPHDPLQELVDKILQSGRRAADLVRQLLAFSRKQIIEPQVLHLNVVVSDMDTMLRRIIGEDIELKISMAPDLWPVKVDPTQVAQVVVNLAVNARDAMPSGGSLTVEAGNVTLDDDYVVGHLGARPGDYVWLAVSDTGTGISREVQAHLFEPFFTTKGVGQGTGLGLAIIYGIVKQSGGDIQVSSEEGVGTTFKIYLPRAEESARPLPGRPEGADMP